MLGERRSVCVVAVVEFEGGPWLEAPLPAERGGVPPVGELADHCCDRCGGRDRFHDSNGSDPTATYESRVVVGIGEGSTVR